MVDRDKADMDLRDEQATVIRSVVADGDASSTAIAVLRSAMGITTPYNTKVFIFFAAVQNFILYVSPMMLLYVSMYYD